jgi:hypothetical protein
MVSSHRKMAETEEALLERTERPFVLPRTAIARVAA